MFVGRKKLYPPRGDKYWSKERDDIKALDSKQSDPSARSTKVPQGDHQFGREEGSTAKRLRSLRSSGQGVLFIELPQVPSTELRGKAKSYQPDKFKPGRKPNACMNFVKKMRPKAVREFPDLNFMGIGSKLGELWRALPYEEKKKHAD